MTNPLLHAMVFIAAIIIPGGLLVYFAWRLRNKATVTSPTPEEAREAFREMFPEGSLRAKSRVDRLRRLRRRKSGPIKKSQ